MLTDEIVKEFQLFAVKVVDALDAKSVFGLDVPLYIAICAWLFGAAGTVATRAFNVVTVPDVLATNFVAFMEPESAASVVLPATL